MCGLKPEVKQYTDSEIEVTPCVGVWIETIMHPRQTGQGIVTPCVGVWIETYSEHIANVQKGHTLRGCVD